MRLKKYMQRLFRFGFCSQLFVIILKSEVTGETHYAISNKYKSKKSGLKKSKSTIWG